MQVAIACKHGHLGPNQEEYITRKAEKLLTYFERVTAINVTVTFEKGGARVEILVFTDAFFISLFPCCCSQKALMQPVACQASDGFR